VTRPIAVAVTPKMIVEMNSLVIAAMDCYFVDKLN